MSQDIQRHHPAWNTNISCVVCVFLEDLLKVDGLDMKISDPITAAHLINAARLGNSKANIVLNKGQHTRVEADTHSCRSSYLNDQNTVIYTLFSHHHSLHSTRDGHY